MPPAAGGRRSGASSANPSSVRSSRRALAAPLMGRHSHLGRRQRGPSIGRGSWSESSYAFSVSPTVRTTTRLTAPTHERYSKARAKSGARDEPGPELAKGDAEPRQDRTRPHRPDLEADLQPAVLPQGHARRPPHQRPDAASGEQSAARRRARPDDLVRGREPGGRDRPRPPGDLPARRTVAREAAGDAALHPAAQAAHPEQDHPHHDRPRQGRAREGRRGVAPARGRGAGAGGERPHLRGRRPEARSRFRPRGGPRDPPRPRPLAGGRSLPMHRGDDTAAVARVRRGRPLPLRALREDRGRSVRPNRGDGAAPGQS